VICQGVLSSPEKRFLEILSSAREYWILKMQIIRMLRTAYISFIFQRMIIACLLYVKILFRLPYSLILLTLEKSVMPE